MTTFTITTTQNVTDLTGKTGGDTYTINGGSLTIDTDSRYGLNQSAESSIGDITISTTLGGVVAIDSRFVRIIPFDTGSGNVPAADTVISQGAVSSKLIGVWPAINVAPIASGSAMPVSGFIKVRQISQVPGFAAGALTGIGAAATGADRAGWLEIIGDESKTCTIPRLGTLSLQGDWFEVGTVGADNTVTYPLPTSGKELTAGNGTWFSGVFVAKTDTPTQDSDYEFYPSLGTYSGVGIAYNDAFRGRVCWITSAGVLYLGKDLAGNSNGYKPPTGRRIVLPNILLINCTATARGVNALPNATLSSRYELATGGGGYVYANYVTSAWYLNFNGCNALELNNVATSDQLAVLNLSAEATITRLGVGFTAMQSQLAFSSKGNLPLITLNDCVFARYGNIVLWLTDVKNLVFNGLRTIFVNGDYYSIYALRCSFICNDWEQIGGFGFLEYCSNTVFDGITYSGVLGANSTRGSRVLSQTIRNTNLKIKNIQFYDAVSYCTSYMISLGSYSNEGVEIESVGSVEAPLNFGSTTVGLLDLGGPFLKGLKVSRVWVKNLGGSYLVSYITSASEVVLQNIFVTAGSAGAAYTVPAKDIQYRGCRLTYFPNANGLSLANGTYWHDYYLTDTGGKIRLQMNGPSESTAAYITLSNGAEFTGSGYLYMPTIGMSVVFESNYWMLGHTGFDSVAPVVSANYTADYQIDTGVGYGNWTLLTTTNLIAENAAIDYAMGFKLKVRLTTSTTNTTATGDVVISTATTAEAQKTLYPLEVATVSVDGLATGSMVKASKVSDGTTLFTGPEFSGAVSFTTGYSGLVAIEARKASASPYYRPWVSQVTTILGATVSATAVQQLDE